MKRGNADWSPFMWTRAAAMRVYAHNQPPYKAEDWVTGTEEDTVQACYCMQNMA
ncbi:MAG: hypothetical protein SPG10_17375 [Enterocloster clostridioformis]|nr:hypothetical protein [Enterocloster clostridioformis]